jgi:hypothetical protein
MRARNKPNKVKYELLKNKNYYGVFNHMIEDNIIYLIGCNSLKSRVIGWLIYALIILSLAYILFTL